MVDIEDDAVVPFVEGLESARCPECGATVQWIVNLDADGTTYKASHCGNDYYLVPHHYRFVVDEGGEEESGADAGGDDAEDGDDEEGSAGSPP